MRLTHKELLVKESRKAVPQRQIEFLIDSGAVHSLVPSGALRELGIEPYKTLTFILADGTRVERQVGDAYFEYQGDGGAAPVIFGEPGDEPLLGATTLESLGLVLNPFQRELYPMRLMLARAQTAGQQRLGRSRFCRSAFGGFPLKRGTSGRGNQLSG